MNLIRLIGDFLHLASILILLYKILTTKSCQGLFKKKKKNFFKFKGVSLKTMELYLIVFLTRYLDLFFSFVSYYNTLMKVRRKEKKKKKKI